MVDKDELVGWHHQCDAHEFEAGIKIGRRNSSFSYADDNTLNGRKPRVTKEPLNESEGGE